VTVAAAAQEQLLDADEVARRLNVSRATAYREMRRAMAHVVIGVRGRRVTESALDSYINRRTRRLSETGSTARRMGRPGTAISTMSPANDESSAPSNTTGPPPAPSSAASNGRPTLRGSASAAEAEQDERQRLQHSVTAALEYLVQQAGSDLAPATLAMYAEKGGHLLRLLGDVDVNVLTLDDTQKYINLRLDEKAHRETVRKELVTLRRALTLAHERNLLRADPRGLIPRFRVRYVPRDRYLTEAELPKLLIVLTAGRRRWVVLAIYTGARASEVERPALGARGPGERPAAPVRHQDGQVAPLDPDRGAAAQAPGGGAGGRADRRRGRALGQRSPRPGRRLPGGRHRPGQPQRPAPHLRLVAQAARRRLDGGRAPARPHHLAHGGAGLRPPRRQDDRCRGGRVALGFG